MAVTEIAAAAIRRASSDGLEHAAVPGEGQEAAAQDEVGGRSSCQRVGGCPGGQGTGEGAVAPAPSRRVHHVDAGALRFVRVAFG